MSRGWQFYWVFVFALSCIAIMQPERALTPKHQTKNQLELQANEKVGSRAGVSQIEGQLQVIQPAEKTERNYGEASRKEKREIDSLKTQIEMAWWAKLMTIATFFATLITAAGLIVLTYTLRYTKTAAAAADKMVIEAGKATKVAKETLAETRRIGFAQTRPYVGFSSIDSIPCPDGRITIVAQIKNAGMTTAVDVRATLEAQVVKGKTLGSFKFLKDKYVRQMDILPGDHIYIADFASLENCDLNQAVALGEISIEIVGFVSYRDVESRIHRTLTHRHIHASKSPMQEQRYLAVSAPRGNRST